MKPVLFLANVSEDELDGSGEYAQKLKTLAAEKGAGWLPLCGSIEEELTDLEPEEIPEFLADLGLKESGLDALARETYKLLGLQCYFTAGPKEIRAWTIPIGAKGPEAAGKIHTDFEKGFIRAEVYTLEALEEYKSEIEIRAKGLLRSEGKEYVVQDGDIVHFRFNV